MAAAAGIAPSPRAPSPRVASPRPAISVDGVVIPHDDIAREAQHHPAATPRAAFDAAARALVIRQLLLAHARRLGLAPAPIGDGQGRVETDEEALIRQVIEREVSAPPPDEAECRRYYAEHPGRFQSPDLFELSHILFAAPPRDTAARARARADAEAAIAALRRRPADFAELAKAQSACPSGRDGGRLGQVTRGQTAPELERAALTLDIGAIAEAPIETRYGFHVLRLDHRAAGRTLPYERVRGRIADYLVEVARRRAIADFIATLAGRATIAGIELRPAADAAGAAGAGAR